MSRQRPWRAEHPDAVIVARPSRWGNPWRVGDLNPYAATEEHPDGQPATAEEVVALYAMGATFLPAEAFAPLRGRDLACWCPLDQPCHADVLLELANPTHRED
ncbi:MAG: DUF4326 domain-containing protein [Nocardioides sp.]